MRVSVLFKFVLICIIYRLLLVCPEGFYGLHCMEFCSCPSAQFVCQVARGCVCRQGFMGPTCETPSRDAAAIASDRENTSSSGTTWGVVVAMLLVGIIVVLVLYYKRRERTLKTVIADVEYHANPQSQPDRNHFDNPVYAFNDNAHLLNNLRPATKASNLERLKRGLGACDDDDSNASSRGKMDLFGKHFFESNLKSYSSRYLLD